MAQSNDARVKMTNRIEGKLAKDFYVWSIRNDCPKDYTVEYLVRELLAGRVRPPKPPASKSASGH